MQKIDFYSSYPHYLDHMVNIWLNLPMKYRGTYYISKNCIEKAKEYGIEYVVGVPNENICLVSSYLDYLQTKGDVVYMEHGIGHTYSNDNPSYAGGKGKDRVILFLNQHHLTQEKNLKTYPNVKGVIVGTPKMDNVKEVEFKGKVVCFSFHWDCKIVPETRSSFEYYRKIIRELNKNKEFKLVMHGHPRENWSVAKSLGIEFIQDIKEVFERVDVYVCDNSSSMYEFMCTGKPIILLNAPFYRKNIHHGIRFWTHIGGIQVDNIKDLLPSIQRTLSNPNEYKTIRDEIVSELYPNRGKATKLSVKAIKELLDNYGII